MPVIETNHTSYTVSDLEKTIEFYRDCMGFQIRRVDRPPVKYMEDITGIEKAEVEVAIVMCPGGHNIELFEYLKPDSRAQYPNKPCDTGSSHMGFVVDDFDETLAKMRTYGFEVVNDTPDYKLPSGVVLHTAYLRNSDGLMIEIIQRD